MAIQEYSPLLRSSDRTEGLPLDVFSCHTNSTIFFFSFLWGGVFTSLQDLHHPQNIQLSYKVTKNQLRDFWWLRNQGIMKKLKILCLFIVFEHFFQRRKLYNITWTHKVELSTERERRKKGDKLRVKEGETRWEQKRERQGESKSRKDKLRVKEGETSWEQKRERQAESKRGRDKLRVKERETNWKSKTKHSKERQTN